MTQPQPLADRIAAAMAGHSANISNGNGTVICNCGATVGANSTAWREHRANTVLAVVQPELDARDTEIRRLRTALSGIESDAERAQNKGYDLDTGDLLLDVRAALRPAQPTTTAQES